MKMNKSKVAIVGCGLVGSTTAYSLVTQGVVDEVLMIDINKERAYGEKLDLHDSIEYLNRNVKVTNGDYSDCSDADIVVITAGAPPKPGQSRLDTLELTANICKSVVGPIMESGFDGIFLIVSNPVDIITHYVKKLSGLPKNQVIRTVVYKYYQQSPQDHIFPQRHLSHYPDCNPHLLPGTCHPHRKLPRYHQEA